VWAAYQCPFEVSVTAAVDLVELAPADDVPIVVTSMMIYVTSELQEAQEEWVEVEIHRGGTAITSGSGGSAAASALPSTPKLPASGFQFEANNTTVATFTGGTIPWRGAFQVRAGGEFRLNPDEYIGCTQANGGMTVRLPNAAGDSIDVKGTVFVSEWI
jgi:hypothetical protein